jgi:hypothetical protein
MKLLSIVESVILLENRKDDAFKKYIEKYYQTVSDADDSVFKSLINTFSEHDPSGNNKYLDWMIKNYLQYVSEGHNNPNTPYVDYIVDLINVFHKNLSKLTPQ